MPNVIPTRIVPSARPAPLAPPEVARSFRRRLEDGATLQPAGSARHDPDCLLSGGYTPKHRVDLFNTTFYLTNVRQNPDIRFFVGYVTRRGSDAIFPRIFYKDLSLVWRSASHYVRSAQENWIGKGDVREYVEDGRKYECSAESTTDLPLEIQTAFENLSRMARRVRYDDVAVGLVLRRGPDDRIEAYEDFRGPRRLARAEPRNRINRGRPVARFTRRGDPTSLRFAAGFQPDFRRGVIEVSHSASRLYGGGLRRFRIVSANRKAQYLFMAGPRQAWIIPAQATTTQLSSYGVRTIDVLADEDLFLPGYEYHGGENGEGADDQIPKGFAGKTSELDPSRADTSPWLDRLPVIREFRRRVLGRRRG